VHPGIPAMSKMTSFFKRFDFIIFTKLS